MLMKYTVKEAKRRITKALDDAGITDRKVRRRILAVIKPTGWSKLRDALPPGVWDRIVSLSGKAGRSATEGTDDGA